MNFDKAINKNASLDAKLIDYDKSNPNYTILESTKNCEGSWKKYEKTGGVWAIRLESKTYIKSLENRTGQIVGKKGEWLLMGEKKNERWSVSNENFKSRFKHSGSSDGRLDEDNRTYEWYERKAGNPVLAIKMYKPFTIVHERSNEPLRGKTGDYIVKHFEDRNNPNPKDVWIVDKRIFEKTYKELI